MSGSNDWPDSMNINSSLLPSATSENSHIGLNAVAARTQGHRSRRLSLVNDRLSPREAMVEDIHFIRRALDAAKVEYFLVRSEDSRSGATRPTIAVNERDKEQVLAALVLACHNEPMYSKAATGASSTVQSTSRRGRARPTHVLVSEGSLGGCPTDRAFVLYRPRVSESGTLRFGSRYGIRLEFWIYGDIDIHLPNGNVVTRAILPRDEVKPAAVERYGTTWPTIDGMWDAAADDVDFPIDIVFSWVDGTDQEWQRARAAKMQSYIVGEGDDHEARFRQINELKFAMRSVHLFAPWIRHIVVVTDSPQPEWLDNHPNVKWTPSSEFFADPSVLPTYNSHAVESQLHRIPGLSEHFVYSNDDMFFGKEVSQKAFFTSGGVSRFIESNTRIGLGEANTSRSGFENAARVNRALLLKKFGRTISRNLEHSPAPLRKSVLKKLEAEFPEEFTRTAAARFRSATDISVTNSLYHYYALMTGAAVPHETLRVKYVDTTAREGITSLESLLRKRDYDFFCLNDGSFPEVPARERVGAVTAFLEDYFPIPAPWERG